jgi:CheY-like chemotaxis protein
MATAVVCDDDSVARAAITVSCEEAGLEVVAETDSGSAAIELIRRFGVDVLVLDLSLSDGSAERIVDQISDEGTDVSIVVFTAYSEDPWRLLRMGVVEVISKPDFEQLQQVLNRVASAMEATLQEGERRSSSREVHPAPKMWRSPSGVSPRHDLTYSLLELEVGDSVLAVTIVGLEALETDVGPILTADCRLAVAGCLREELRIQDLLHEAPEIDGFVALLRGGDARAGGAAWSRLTTALRSLSLPGEVKGAAGRVDSMGANDAVARTVGSLQTASVGSPAFLSV